MRLFLQCLRYAALFMLTACSHTVVAPPPHVVRIQQAAHHMVPLHTEEVPEILGFLEFSENGKTFVVAGEKGFLFLYDADKLEKRVAIYEDQDDNRYGKFDVVAAGYIDDNTWYFATRSYGDSLISVRQLEPKHEIYQQNMGMVSINPIAVNQSHIASDHRLWNWHDNSAAVLALTQPAEFGYRLTPDSVVITRDLSGNIFFYDPLKQRSTQWHIRSGDKVWFSADARYGLLLPAQGQCELWRLQLPQPALIAPCGESDFWWGKSRYVASFARDGSAFAVAAKNEVVVYATQPLEPILTASMPNEVTGLALDADRLAVADMANNLRVWDTDTKVLHSEYLRNSEPVYSHRLLAFQPGGRKLLSASYWYLTVFDIDGN